MSTWTSETRRIPSFWLPATLLLFLAGCFEAAPLSRFSSRDAVPGPAILPVLGGSVTVTGPEGYCIDSRSTVEGDSEAFVLLIRCRNNERRRPVLGATVTALPAEAATGAANLSALMETVTGEMGRGYLSRSGRAEDVRIVESRIESGAVWLRIEDASTPETFAPGYWRAVLPVGARVVSLSVLDVRGTSGTRAAGLSILQDFVARMRAANPG